MAHGRGHARGGEHPQSRFYCDTEQGYYNNVTWVYLRSDLYLLPKIFAVQSFRPVLDALFPRRMAITRILRNVMPPANTVWTRIKNCDRGYLQQAYKRLGIQIRYRGFNKCTEPSRKGFCNVHWTITFFHPCKKPRMTPKLLHPR